MQYRALGNGAPGCQHCDERQERGHDRQKQTHSIHSQSETYTKPINPRDVLEQEETRRRTAWGAATCSGPRPAGKSQLRKSHDEGEVLGRGRLPAERDQAGGAYQRKKNQQSQHGKRRHSTTQANQPIINVAPQARLSM